MTKADTLLGIYRVLDLTDEKGMLCGKILADLGADVIKVEKPGGDKARSIGPFYRGIPNPNKSLFWFAFNTNKRSVTLNIETDDGQNIFKRLVQTADIIIESFNPAYLDKLELGYADLAKINPKIIMTSITPFGQDGPYEDYKGSDLVAWALGGVMSDTGDADRPPLQCTMPQSYFAASTYAAEGTMVALYGRCVSGEGQHVDVSAQATITWFMSEVIPFWVTVGELIKRSGARWTRVRGLKTPVIWPCRNGYISYVFLGSQAGAEVNIKMTKWLEEEGFATKEIMAMDWYQFDYGGKTQEMLDSLLEPIGKLFLSHTKEELYAEAIKRVIPLYPVADSKYTLENPQLKARDFWVKLKHDELGSDITYPGPFAVFSETPIKMRCRAPLVGEHNEEIYLKELGLTQDELVILSGAGII